MTHTAIAGREVPDGHEPGRKVDLQLDRRIGERSWLGHTDDGVAVIAVRLFRTPGPTTQEAARLIERATALADVRSPHLVHALGVGWAQAAVWVVSERGEGVSLARLLQVAGLTPAQAVLVGCDLLAGLQALQTVGYDLDGVNPNDVRIDRSGRARLTGWAPTVLLGDWAVPLESRGRSAAAVLADLARAARRLSPRAGPQVALIEHLDAAAEQLQAPAADLAAIEGALNASIGEALRLDARAELATLADAVAGDAASGPVAPKLRARSRPAPAGSGGRVGALLRATTGWLSKWLAAFLILALAAGVELIFLRGKIIDGLHRLSGDSSTARSSTPTPSKPVPSRRAPAPVAAPAPAAAGAISLVGVRALTPCVAGHSCAVRVLLQLRPATRPVTVRWSFQVVDRCTGAKRSAPGGSVVLPPKQRSVDAVSTVRLPAGRALSVTAVTSRPARAASPPLLLPRGGGTC